MTLKIKKRDGNLEFYNVDKIKKVINWACEGIENVESIVLESSLQPIVKEGITTVEIHEQLIQKAKELISLEQPNWKYVAGRLLMQTIWKESKSNRGFTYNDYGAFISWLEEQKEKSIYKYHLQEGFYSSEELKEAYDYIKPERDFLFDYSGSFLLKQRYLLPNELPQEMFLIIALLISKDEPNKLELVKQIYDGLSLLKISFATPILLNFRKPNGNTSSCFTLTVDDSLDSIFDNIKNAARISKQGGGVGCVDGETEYLTPYGWRKISNYNYELVAQYNPDTDSISYVTPLEYIKVPCEEIHYFQTKYGISQKICDDHKVLYYSEQGKNIQKPITGLQLSEKFTQSDKGFRGLIKCGFTSVEAEGLDYSDNDLKLITAIQADGSFTNENTTRCVFGFKKKRKAVRLEKLLDELSIEYKSSFDERGRFWYYFYAPYKIKHFPLEFYQLNTHQLGIIAEESMYWDGCVSEGTYSTRVESDADFIQYAWTSQGKRCSKKTYLRESGIDYVVYATDNQFCGMRTDSRNANNNLYSKVKTTDGFKYCFTVQTGYLILRHNDQIFLTHNCCISNVRATGSSVNGNLNASGGVLPWIKLFNDTAVAVNQVGSYIY